MVQTTAIQDSRFTFYAGFVADSLTAATTGTQAAALALTDQVNRVTSATAGASVALPPVVGPTGTWNLKGSPVRVINSTANAILAYPASGSGDTINGLSSTTAIPLPAGATATFVSATGYPRSKTGNWIATLNTGSAGVLPSATIVAAAGSNSQSGSTSISPGVVIVGTVSGSTRGIRLSVAGTGKNYWVFNDTAFNMKVYPLTNGTIGASSTNTAATISARKASVFYARNATHFVTDVGA